MVALTGTAAWLLTLAMASSPVALQTPVPDAADGTAIASNRMVVGILSYTEWPTRRDPVRLCLTGASINTQRIGTEPLTDGRRISVLKDWDGEGDKAAFLRAVRDGACSGFATVLSPDYNAAHADHFHLDQDDRWAGVCR